MNQPFGTAWIIGASSGIGRALAKVMVKDGTKVTVSARRAADLDTLKNEIGSDKITALPLDVTDAESVLSAIEGMKSENNIPDVVVIAAAIYEQADADNLDPDMFAKMMAVNYIGAVNVFSALVPVLTARGLGHIAVVSSVAGYRGLPLATAYGPTKAALINFCESLRPQLSARGIHLQVINPGFVDTPLTSKNKFSMPFMISPEAAARRLHKGLQSRRFEVTFPKRFTWIMKLIRILPYSLYFALVNAITRRQRRGVEKQL